MGIFGSRDGILIVVVGYGPRRLFGLFQILLGGWPVGDGTTSAFYPHYCGLQELAGLAESGGPHASRRLALGEGFDHVQVWVEVTEHAIMFSIYQYAGESWHEASVGKAEFLVAWRQAAACIEEIFAESGAQPQ